MSWSSDWDCEAGVPTWRGRVGNGVASRCLTSLCAQDTAGQERFRCAVGGRWAGGGTRRVWGEGSLVGAG